MDARTSEMEALSRPAAVLVQLSPATYVTYNVYVLTHDRVLCLPALLAMAAAPRSVAGSRTLLAVAAAVAVGRGGRGRRVAGATARPAIPGRCARSAALGSCSAASGRCGAAALARIRGCAASGWRLAACAWRCVAAGRRAACGVLADVTPRDAGCWVYFAAYIALVNVLWFYNDRYVLVLLPLLVVVALGHSGQTAPTLAWVLRRSSQWSPVVGVRDELRFNQAVRDTWQSLVDSGVPPADIDAGYAWTGWILYAHPENLAPGQTADDVPWVKSKRRAAAIGWRRARWRATASSVRSSGDDDTSWPGPDRLYMLKQRPAAATKSPRPAKPSG